MSSSLAIRPASVTDAAPLAALAAATFTEAFGHLYPPEDLKGYLDEGYTPEAFAGLLTQVSYRLWVAEGFAGYAQAGPCKLPHPEARPEQGELMRLYVTAPHRGSGLAQAMMSEVIAWLERTFVGPQWLGVYSGNHRAQRFYARFGFAKVGEYDYPVGRVRDREFIYRRERS